MAHKNIDCASSKDIRETAQIKLSLLTLEQRERAVLHLHDNAFEHLHHGVDVEQAQDDRL